MIHVLVVDDEPLAVQSTRKLLTSEFPDMRVEIAQDGFEALQRCKETAFHIVLMDIAIPGLDGLAVLQKIKGITPRTRMVIVSAYSKFEFARTAVSLGVVHYMLKPFVHREFIMMMRHLIEEIYMEQKQQRFDQQTEQNVQKRTEYLLQENGAMGGELRFGVGTVCNEPEGLHQ